MAAGTGASIVPESGLAICVKLDGAGGNFGVSETMRTALRYTILKIISDISFHLDIKHCHQTIQLSVGRLTFYKDLFFYSYLWQIVGGERFCASEPMEGVRARACCHRRMGEK